MPTVADIRPYKLFFYSAEGAEPRHVHVRRGCATAKYWLDPVRLGRSRGFNDHELHKIQRIVAENRARIVEVWNEHFGN